MCTLKWGNGMTYLSDLMTGKILCSTCKQSEAVHTIANFYHDFGSVMYLEPVCEECSAKYNTFYRGNQDIRGYATAFNVLPDLTLRNFDQHFQFTVSYEFDDNGESYYYFPYLPGEPKAF